MRLPLLVLMLVLARFVKGNGKVQPAAVRGKEGRRSAGVS
jgi:hypothetical protein